MPTDIVVPQIGEAISELRIVAWYKQVGDDVKVGDLLFEVDSDKAIVEVEAFVDGKLIEILAPADSAVMPQEVVARVVTADETLPAPREVPVTLPDSSSDGKKPSGANVSPVAQRMAAQMGVSLDGITGSGINGRITAEDVQSYASQQTVVSERILASPKARNLAKSRGVDLATLTGSGVDGLIVVRDVESAAPTPTTTATPMSKLRQTIAANMLASKQQVPHFYLMADVDMSEANRLRDYCRDLPGWERAPTYTDIMIRACALSIAEMPAVNRSFNNGGFVERQQVGIGVAVAVDEGLIVPTMPDADQHSLQSIAEILRGLGERARSGRLKPADLGEKSMVISNLGMYGVDAFIAIIDMPDPMILAVGQVADRLVPVNGQAVIKPMCTLSLSVDHRVLDGVQGAQFLGLVKNRLENPFDILG